MFWHHHPLCGSMRPRYRYSSACSSPSSDWTGRPWHSIRQHVATKVDRFCGGRTAGVINARFPASVRTDESRLFSINLTRLPRMLTGVSGRRSSPKACLVLRAMTQSVCRSRNTLSARQHARDSSRSLPPPVELDRRFSALGTGDLYQILLQNPTAHSEQQHLGSASLSCSQWPRASAQIQCGICDNLIRCCR